MRATVQAADLSTILKRGVAVTGKTTLDVLSHVLIRTDRDGITIESTDLNTYMRDRIPARVDEAGEALLDCIIRTADGELTAAELLGHREFSLTRLYESA